MRVGMVYYILIYYIYFLIYYNYYYVSRHINVFVM